MNKKILAKLIMIAFVLFPLFMVSHNYAKAESSHLKTLTEECTVSIGPSDITIRPGETVQIVPSTICDGEVVPGIYVCEFDENGCGSSLEGCTYYPGTPAPGTTSCTDIIKVTDISNGNISTTIRVTVKGCESQVSINPCPPILEFGEIIILTATTTCYGDTIPGKYTWSVSGGTADTISGDTIVVLPTCGENTITVMDELNEAISPTCIIFVFSPITVVPALLLRSRWMMLPALMTIYGGACQQFDESSSLSFNPTTSVLPIASWMWGKKTIGVLILVMPSWSIGIWDESETVTITVDGVSDGIIINMQPFPLDEQKGLK